ncbi:MAG: hypothetical protein WC756_08695 [Taibaiella sp.]
MEKPSMFEDFSMIDKKGVRQLKDIDSSSLSKKKYIILKYQDSNVSEILVHDPLRDYIDHVKIYKMANYDVYKVIFNRDMVDVGKYYYITYSNQEMRRYLFMSKIADEDSVFLSIVCVYKPDKRYCYTVHMPISDTTNFIYRIKDLEDTILQKHSTGSSVSELRQGNKMLFESDVLL